MVHYLLKIVFLPGFKNELPASLLKGTVLDARVWKYTEAPLGGILKCVETMDKYTETCWSQCITLWDNKNLLYEEFPGTLRLRVSTVKSRQWIEGRKFSVQCYKFSLQCGSRQGRKAIWEIFSVSSCKSKVFSIQSITLTLQYTQYFTNFTVYREVHFYRIQSGTLTLQHAVLKSVFQFAGKKMI